MDLCQGFGDLTVQSWDKRQVQMIPLAVLCRVPTQGTPGLLLLNCRGWSVGYRLIIETILRIQSILVSVCCYQIGWLDAEYRHLLLRSVSVQTNYSLLYIGGMPIWSCRCTYPWFYMYCISRSSLEMNLQSLFHLRLILCMRVIVDINRNHQQNAKISNLRLPAPKHIDRVSSPESSRSSQRRPAKYARAFTDPSQSFQPRPDLASTVRTGRKAKRGDKMRRLARELENNNSLRFRAGGLPNWRRRRKWTPRASEHHWPVNWRVTRLSEKSARVLGRLFPEEQGTTYRGGISLFTSRCTDQREELEKRWAYIGSRSSGSFCCWIHFPVSVGGFPPFGSDGCREVLDYFYLKIYTLLKKDLA